MKRVTVIAVVLLSLVTAIAPSAAWNAPQDKPAASGPRPIGYLDIMAWKSISSTALSTNGEWFGYRLSPAEGDGEVIIRQTRGTKEYKFPAGQSRTGQVAFSDDAKFAAFMTYPTASETKALRKDRKPIYTKASVLNLATGEKADYDRIRNFTFSGENPGWIGLSKAAPESQARERDKWSGSDLILRELATGKEVTFGNVSEFSFDKKGRRLAFIIDAMGMAGNGVLLRNMQSGAVTSLDNDKANYRSLAWSEKGEALACLKGKEDKAYEDKMHAVVGFAGFDPAGTAAEAEAGVQKVVYDPKEDKSFPSGMTISPNRTPQWTEDFETLLFGIHEPGKKQEGGASPAAPDTAPPAGAAPPAAAGTGADEDMPDLVLWHYQDKRLQSQQQVQATSDRNFSFLSEYRIKDKKFIRLADDEVRMVQASPKGLYALGQDNREYELDSNLDGRRYQDVYTIDMKTGARSLALKKSRYSYSISPDATHFLYYDDGVFHVWDMASGKSFPITKGVPANFVNEDDDHNVKNPPDPFVGWAKDGQSVFLSEGYDIWNVPVHGGNAANLTLNGRKDQIRYRSLTSLDPEDKGVDLSKPLYVSMYGEWTKKGGIGLLEPGKTGITVLRWEDAGFGMPMKAKEADVYLYTRDTNSDYPNYHVADRLLKGGEKITDANPQQKDFVWGHRVLFDFKNKDGVRLQGILAVPDDYKPGEKRPMIVTFYEKNSQNMHVYTPPVYMVSMGRMPTQAVSNGYLTMMPDVHFRTGSSHSDMLECVEAATRKVIEMGYADPKRIGVTGHSYGGEGAAYIGTMSRMFAAVGMGAGVVDLYNDFNMPWGWSYAAQGGSGDTAFQYYLYDQGRWGFSPWDQPDRYRSESAITWAPKAAAPFLIMHGTSDPTVGFINGLAFYNALRYNGKKAVLLAYPGEGHHLGGLANQKDLTVRFMEFFDHYLKGAPAPKWLTEGVPYLKKQANPAGAK